MEAEVVEAIEAYALRSLRELAIGAQSEQIRYQAAVTLLRYAEVNNPIQWKLYNVEDEE